MNLTNINDIKALLSRHGFHFSKSMGQNFLVESWVPHDIAEAAALDTVSRCALTNDYYYPDIETKHPRYQAVFDVILF